MDKCANIVAIFLMKVYNVKNTHKKKGELQMNTFQFLPEGWEENISDIQRENINEYIYKDSTLQGVVQECDKDFNLHVQLGNNIMGIMPREEVEAIHIEQDGLPKQNLCTGKVHKYVQFKINGINEQNIPILSRKRVQEEAVEAIKNNLHVGDKISGIVKNITPYGAFIEIGGGVVGLAHIEDLSVARIKTPYERLKTGQKVDVVVKSIDRDTGRISLSYKENYGTWEENAQKFQIGDKVKGIVRETEKNKNGIFIELSPNLVGMSEFKPGLQYGQTIDVYIKKIDYNKKKIKLFIL